MSIYVCMARRRHSFDSSGESIGKDIWRSLALCDGQFRLPTQLEMPEARRGQRNPSFLVSTGNSTVGEAWLRWYNREILLKSPREPIIVKAMPLAHGLDARVVSEIGEGLTRAELTGALGGRRADRGSRSFALVLSVE